MSGYNGPKNLDQLAQLAYTRISSNQWFYMPVFGETGFGKTSFAGDFCHRVHQLIGRPFDARRQVVWTAPEFKVARRTLPPISMIMRNEFVKAGGNRRRSTSRVNSETMEDANTGRKLGHGILDLIPFYDDADPRTIKHSHWTTRMNGLGKGTCYEVRRVGFKHIDLWEEPRFTFEVDDLRVTHPELWAAIEDRDMDHARGLEDGLLAREERVASYRGIARQVLRAPPTSS